ncbi:MAG: hypothetical protein II426_00750, partial [Methanobrevibacter sp.]|nr:hypothetical protein [Methanobrevibacter sp.]
MQSFHQLHIYEILFSAKACDVLYAYSFGLSVNFTTGYKTAVEPDENVPYAVGNVKVATSDCLGSRIMAFLLSTL